MVERLELLGIPCPLNWARAKARLEEMTHGERLELLVDDPRALTDIPRAAEMCGYAVLKVTRLETGARILIER